MKKNFIFMTFFVLVSPVISGELIDRGSGLIYDEDLNITWMQVANTPYYPQYCIDYPERCRSSSGLMTYEQAQAFIDWFNNVYVLPWPAGERNWRLPITPTAPDMSCSQEFNSGFGCILSELGHLYYVELGNLAGEGGLINRGPFLDIEIDFNYWTEWDFVSPGTSDRMSFKFRNGLQIRSDINESHYVWLVHDGDVAPRTECNDGIDNDCDGAVDMNDQGCSSPSDNDERSIIVRPEHRIYPFELIPVQAYVELWLGDWPVVFPDKPCNLPLCPDPPLSANIKESRIPPGIISLRESLWRIAKSDTIPKLFTSETKNLLDIINKLPLGIHFNKEVKGNLINFVKTTDFKQKSVSAGELFASGILIKALNAIELDWRLPVLKPQNVKTGKNVGVDLGGMVWIDLKDVEKSGDIGLAIISKYESFPVGKEFSPSWPFFTYKIDFNGSFGPKGYMDLTFYVGPLRFKRGITSLRVMRLEKERLVDITTGMDLSHGILMARTDLPGTFIIVGRN
ncbi:MAG: hypothetical protein IQL11_16635 [Bacteroidales bacterium]|nr:hypothetical protein [Bacteroidales bacterium]